MKDYYTVLGIAPTATTDEIRAAYRKLALQCHPDRNPGDKDAEERFKSISAAYDILSDGEKRRQYDRFGEAASPAAAATRAYGNSNLDDIFEMMGQVFGASSPFQTTAKKAPKKKASTAGKTCGKCKGEGMIGTDLGFFMFKIACPTCLGTGRVI